jgi:hypothetical protein
MFTVPAGGGQAESLTITPQGDVGIGRPTPVAKLDILGNSASTALYSEARGGGWAGWFQGGNVFAPRVIIGNPNLGFFSNAQLEVGGDIALGGHLNQKVGSGGGVDAVGGLTILTGNTFTSAGFRVPFSNIPVCVVTPVQDPGTRYWVTATTSEILIHIPGPASFDLTLNYICVGHPN